MTGVAAGAASTDAVLAACRVLVALSVRSLGVVQGRADLMDVRALTVIASEQPMTLTALARSAGMHLSRASRLCDRLVERGLIARDDDPADRRSLRLTLTERGERVVADVAAARRTELEPALARMPSEERTGLVVALRRFSAAAGEPEPAELWALGWSTRFDEGEIT